MPTYVYRCPWCGPFDVVRPMAETDAIQNCATCGSASRRLFSPPAVRRVGAPLAGALAAQERSAHEPQVVTDLPASRRPSNVTTDPRHAALPRP